MVKGIKMRSIAYFGFAANPPHRGHKEVIEWLSRRYNLVIIGPSAAHAFNKRLPPMSVRLPLCEALLKEVNKSNVDLATIEEALMGSGPVYSYDVLCALKAFYPGDEIHLAVGPDNAEPAIWSKFHRADDIEKHFGRVVAPDMGNNKRSTQIRAMLAAGASYEDLATVATPSVAKLIMDMPIYRNPDLVV